MMFDLFFLSRLFIFSAMSRALERSMSRDLVPYQRKISEPASSKKTLLKSNEEVAVSTCV